MVDSADKTNSNNEETKKTYGNEEVVSLDQSDDNELKDEINNTRKTRRRSSASIE